MGSALARHVGSSDRMTSLLDDRAPAWAHRLDTDGRTVTDLAAEVASTTGWLGR